MYRPAKTNIWYVCANIWYVCPNIWYAENKHLVIGKRGTHVQRNSGDAGFDPTGKEIE